MDNGVNLISGRKYRVVKPFTDFDHQVHPIGESWTYVGTNFLPYDDGLTLHVLVGDKKDVYRLQWVKEQQADIIENFKDFVELCPD
jgi:hypothetical protein